MDERKKKGDTGDRSQELRKMGRILLTFFTDRIRSLNTKLEAVNMNVQVYFSLVSRLGFLMFFFQL